METRREKSKVGGSLNKNFSASLPSAFAGKESQNATVSNIQKIKKPAPQVRPEIENQTRLKSPQTSLGSTQNACMLKARSSNSGNSLKKADSQVASNTSDGFKNLHNEDTFQRQPSPGQLTSAFQNGKQKSDKTNISKQPQASTSDSFANESTKIAGGNSKRNLRSTSRKSTTAQETKPASIKVSKSSTNKVGEKGEPNSLLTAKSSINKTTDKTPQTVQSSQIQPSKQKEKNVVINPLESIKVAKDSTSSSVRTHASTGNGSSPRFHKGPVSKNMTYSRNEKFGLQAQGVPNYSSFQPSRQKLPDSPDTTKPGQNFKEKTPQTGLNTQKEPEKDCKVPQKASENIQKDTEMQQSEIREDQSCPDVKIGLKHDDFEGSSSIYAKNLNFEGKSSSNLISESGENLPENPLVAVIKKFQAMKTGATDSKSGDAKKPSINEFLTCFESEMLNCERAYHQTQQVRHDQMRLFEQTYGAGQQNNTTSHNTNNLPHSSTNNLGNPSPPSQQLDTNSSQHHNNQNHNFQKPIQQVGSAAAGFGQTITTYDQNIRQYYHNNESTSKVTSTGYSAQLKNLQIPPEATNRPRLASHSEVDRGNSAIGRVQEQKNMQSSAALEDNNSAVNLRFADQIGQQETPSNLNENNTNSSCFGDVQVNKTYKFSQNSLLAFYPRDVRRCLTRRKNNIQAQNNNNGSATNQNFDKILGGLKPPKQPEKAKKIRSKMHTLGLCQINMMQTLLTKISRKSKIIRKQERIVNENLKRKRIYLERERFDIMTVLNQAKESSQSNYSQPSLHQIHLENKSDDPSGSNSHKNMVQTYNGGQEQQGIQNAHEIGFHKFGDFQNKQDSLVQGNGSIFQQSLGGGENKESTVITGTLPDSKINNSTLFKSLNETQPGEGGPKDSSSVAQSKHQSSLISSKDRQLSVERKVIDAFNSSEIGPAASIRLSKTQKQLPSQKSTNLRQLLQPQHQMHENNSLRQTGGTPKQPQPQPQSGYMPGFKNQAGHAHPPRSPDTHKVATYLSPTKIDSIMLCCSEQAEVETPLFDKRDSEIDMLEGANNQNNNGTTGAGSKKKSGKRGSAKGVQKTTLLKKQSSQQSKIESKKGKISPKEESHASSAVVINTTSAHKSSTLTNKSPFELKLHQTEHLPSNQMQYAIADLNQKNTATSTNVLGSSMRTPNRGDFLRHANTFGPSTSMQDLSPLDQHPNPNPNSLTIPHQQSTTSHLRVGDRGDQSCGDLSPLNQQNTKNFQEQSNLLVQQGGRGNGNGVGMQDGREIQPFAATNSAYSPLQPHHLPLVQSQSMQVPSSSYNHHIHNHHVSQNNHFQSDSLLGQEASNGGVDTLMHHDSADNCFNYHPNNPTSSFSHQHHPHNQSHQQIYQHNLPHHQQQPQFQQLFGQSVGDKHIHHQQPQQFGQSNISPHLIVQDLFFTEDEANVTGGPTNVMNNRPKNHSNQPSDNTLFFDNLGVGVLGGTVGDSMHHPKYHQHSQVVNDRVGVVGSGVGEVTGQTQQVTIDNEENSEQSYKEFQAHHQHQSVEVHSHRYEAAKLRLAEEQRLRKEDEEAQEVAQQQQQAALNDSHHKSSSQNQHHQTTNSNQHHLSSLVGNESSGMMHQHNNQGNGSSLAICTDQSLTPSVTAGAGGQTNSKGSQQAVTTHQNEQVLVGNVTAQANDDVGFGEMAGQPRHPSVQLDSSPIITSIPMATGAGQRESSVLGVNNNGALEETPQNGKQNQMLSMNDHSQQHNPSSSVHLQHVSNNLSSSLMHQQNLATPATVNAQQTHQEKTPIQMKEPLSVSRIFVTNGTVQLGGTFGDACVSGFGGESSAVRDSISGPAPNRNQFRVGGEVGHPDDNGCQQSQMHLKDDLFGTPNTNLVGVGLSSGPALQGHPHHLASREGVTVNAWQLGAACVEHNQKIVGSGVNANEGHQSCQGASGGIINGSSEDFYNLDSTKHQHFF